MNLSKIKYLLVLIVVVLFFFYSFLIQGKIPIPADTIVGMYHPFKDVVWDDFSAGVPFKNYLTTDPVRQLYVWKKLAINLFKQQKLPLWNPYTHAGTPLLANFQTGAFYPLNLLFLLFNFNFAWGIYISLQPILGGIFLYFFLKSLRLSPPACAFGSLVFIFCGFSIAWLQWGNVGHTALWLPLALLSIEKIIKNPPSFCSKYSFFFLLSLVCSFLAGHLQTSFYLLLFLIFYLVFRIQSVKRPDKFKLASLFLALFLIFIFITAVQWLPTMEFINLSNRQIDQAEIARSTKGFLPYQNLLQLFIPDFFGNPTTLNYWGKWNYAEFVSFIGVVPLFFALFALFTTNSKKFKKYTLFFFLAILFCLLFALPTPLGKLPSKLNLPLITSAQPSRLIFLIDFSLACLSGLGLQIFLTRFSKKEIFKKSLLIGICFLIFFVALWTHLLFTAPKLLPDSLLTQNILVSQRNSVLPTTIFFSLFFLLIVSRKKRNNLKAKTVVLIGLLLLTLFDLLRFSFKFTPFSKRDWIFPRTQTIDFLSQEKDLYRYMILDRRIFPPNFSINYQLKTIEGYDPLYLYSYADLITQMETGKKQEKPASFNRIIRPGNYQSEITKKLSVKYLLALKDIDDPSLKKVFQEGKTIIYENEKVKPLLRFQNERRENKTKIIKLAPGEIILETDTQGPNQLIYAANFYPGWQAEVNGKSIPIAKTPEGFILVNLPVAKNQVKLFYKPSSFRTGLFLSALGVVALTVFLILSQTKKCLKETGV